MAGPCIIRSRTRDFGRALPCRRTPVDVYSSIQLVRIAPLSHMMMGCGRRCDADRLLVSHYLQTLARDMAALLAGCTFLDQECATQHSPRWSGAACGVGRGRPTRCARNERSVMLLYTCHLYLACIVHVVVDCTRGTATAHRVLYRLLSTVQSKNGRLA